MLLDQSNKNVDVGKIQSSYIEYLKEMANGFSSLVAKHKQIFHSNVKEIVHVNATIMPYVTTRS